MFVSAAPLPRLEHLAGPARAGNAFDFYPGAAAYRSGRHALWAALAQLDAPPGSPVLVPDSSALRCRPP